MYNLNDLDILALYTLYIITNIVKIDQEVPWYIGQKTRPQDLEILKGLRPNADNII